MSLSQIIPAIGVLLSVVAIISRFLTSKLEFVEQYDDDIRKYEEACSKLYQALVSGNDSIADPLYNYLLSKLNLDGVAPWAFWGKSVRMFFYLQRVSIWSAVCVLVLYFVFWTISKSADQAALSTISDLVLILAFYLLAVLLILIVTILRCNTLLRMRKGNRLASPTEKMLREDKLIPDFGLVLLSSLVSKTKKND